MYYYKDVVMDVEDLIMDFLVYRKNMKQPQLKIQNQTAVKNSWANYKKQEYLPLPIANQNQEVEYNNFRPTGGYSEEQSNYVYQNMQEQQEPAEGTFPEPLNDPVQDAEMEFMNMLYSQLGQKLQPYITTVLDEFEYEGSPVFTDQIDKETIAQIVDRVIELAAADLPEVSDVTTELNRQVLGRYVLLRALVESLVLIELFGRRRPSYRKIFTNGWDYTPYI